MTRPRGSYGAVAKALLGAAVAGGPAPVRVLAERACVGYRVARYTASRLVACGDLEVHADSRPAVLAAVQARCSGGAPPQVCMSTAQLQAEMQAQLDAALRAMVERRGG